MPIAILVAGFFLTRSAEAITWQTGLGTSFVGAVLVAAATSLPEISTTCTAVLLGNHSMAFSNIFGTSIIDSALVFFVDLTYAQGPVLNDVGDFAQFGALLGVAVTMVYLTGLLVRRVRRIWRFGLDSLVVLVVYLSGVVVLYSLRASAQEIRAKAAEIGTSLQEVQARPRAYLHPPVVLAGNVREVLSEHAFVLSDGNR